MMLRYEWDKWKSDSNIKKHRISFDEASTVFRDPLARIFDDEKHSKNEIREIIIGFSINNRLLVISFTEKDLGLVRIISARIATKREKEEHGNY